MQNVALIFVILFIATKQNFIKMTLHKEYIHVVRYDYQTLLRKIKEIKDFEEAENSNQAAQSLGKENDASKIRKQLDSTSTSEGISTGGSSSPCPHEPTVKEKFSSRVFKNLFSIVTSPMSERRTDKGGATTQQCKKSKSSSSPSLARQDGTGVKGGSKSSTGEARHEKKRAKQAASEIKQDGSTVWRFFCSQFCTFYLHESKWKGSVLRCVDFLCRFIIYLESIFYSFGTPVI